MPSNIINTFADKSGKSKEEVENLWDKALKIAKEDPKVDNEYAYATGILKKMLSIKENKDMNKREERRNFTRQFIQKVMDKQKFDAVADIQEMIRLSKEIRYEKIASDVTL